MLLSFKLKRIRDYLGGGAVGVVALSILLGKDHCMQLVDVSFLMTLLLPFAY